MYEIGAELVTDLGQQNVAEGIIPPLSQGLTELHTLLLAERCQWTSLGEDSLVLLYWPHGAEGRPFQIRLASQLQNVSEQSQELQNQPTGDLSPDHRHFGAPSPAQQNHPSDQQTCALTERFSFLSQWVLCVFVTWHIMVDKCYISSASIRLPTINTLLHSLSSLLWTVTIPSTLCMC